MVRRGSCVFEQTPSFIMENGIVKGEELSYLNSEHINFGEMLLETMKKDPNFIGQVDSTTGIEDTFENMVDRSVRCALWMKSQNIQPGDVIGICSHNHKNSVMPWLASLYTGIVCNPWWDHGLTKDVARHFISLAKPKILFVNENCAKIVMEVLKEDDVNLKTIVFGSFPGLESFREIIERQNASEVRNFQCTKLSSVEHPALILYTSGTTGMPKGALHSHKSMFGNVKLGGQLGIGGSISIWYSTLCWVTGILFSLSSIAYKSRRIIANNFSPDGLCQFVEKYKIEWTLMGTSMANRLLTSGVLSKYNMSSLEFMWVGGAVLKEESQKALYHALPNTRIFQAYGATELGGLSVHQTNNHKLNSIGTLGRGLEMKIIDPDSGKILGANEKGEMCFKSPFMMTKYYNNPEKTKEAIDSEGWLHTGDLSFYDEEGYVYIIDRLKELIKWRGHHVSPAVIEQLIQTYPGVLEAAVVAVPDLEDDEQPFAFIATTPNANISKENITKLVEDNLPEQMQLRAGVTFLDQIPHTASGKIGRSELKKMALVYAKKS